MSVSNYKILTIFNIIYNLTADFFEIFNRHIYTAYI